MQHSKQIIQLSDHVKNKIRSYQPTPYSFSSDELDLSDNTDNDQDSSVFVTPQRLYRRRSSTFTTYQIQPPSESESFFTDKRSKSERKPTPKQKPCQECLHRDKLFESEHQRLLRAYDENEKLTQQLQTSFIHIRKYQDENLKLKEHLIKLNSHIQQYQINCNLLKQKLITEKNNKSKQEPEFDQLQRLRHELQVYNQVVTAKRQDEQKQMNYYSYRNIIHR